MQVAMPLPCKKGLVITGQALFVRMSFSLL